MLQKPDIKVSTKDYDKIYEHLDKLPKNVNTQRLVEELERAEIVDTALMPGNVVAMHSRVRFTEISSNKSYTYTLVYPEEVSAEDDISILAPVGSAILGLSLGDEIEWPLGTDKSVRVRIEDIASGKIGKNTQS